MSMSPALERKDAMTANDYPHQGITMHRLRVGGGFAGLIFTLGTMFIFLVGVPVFWVFLVLAIICGAVLALILRKRKPREIITIRL